MCRWMGWPIKFNLTGSKFDWQGKNVDNSANGMRVTARRISHWCSAKKRSTSSALGQVQEKVTTERIAEYERLQKIIQGKPGRASEHRERALTF